MSAPVPARDLRQQVEAELARQREELVRGLRVDSLAALALVPVWTERLAEQVRFPVDARGSSRTSAALQVFLEEAEKRSLCVRGPQDETAWTTRRARVLMLLWRSMAPAQRVSWVNSILEQVQRVPSALERLQYLIALSPAAGDRLTVQIGSSIERWPNEDVRNRLWIAWALESRGHHGFHEAWSASSTMPPGEDRARIQIALFAVATPSWEAALEAEVAQTGTAPGRTGPGLSPAVRNSITAVRDEEACANALLAFAKVAGEDSASALVAEALEHIARIDDAEERAMALAAASVAFSEEPREDLVRRGLRTVAEIAGPVARARALFGIPPGGSDDERLRLARKTLDELMQSIDEGPQRDRALVLLVGAIARTDLAMATAIRRRIQDPSAQLDALVAVTAADTAGTLPPAEIGSEVGALIERTGRYEVCGDFILYLTPGLSALPSYVEQIEATASDPRRRREALVNIAAHVPPQFARPILGKVLRSAATLVEERDLLDAFAQVAPQLPDELMDEACNVALSLSPARTFTMPDSMRPHVLEYLSQSSGAGSAVLQKTLVDLGQRIADAAARGTGAVPLATARWARVASLCDRPVDAAGVLVREIGKLVDNGELGAAIEWYTTAERIAAVAGGQLREAILLGRRGVEVASRRIMDARHLERYLHREEQGRAFQALLDDPEHWALHYLGMGGIGKTMLLRHIMARLAARDGTRLAVARVDFDEMSPEFPVRQPGTLLMGLAEDLRRWLPAGHDDRFTKFRDDVVELHGALNRDVSPDNPLDNIRGEEFGRVIEKFAALLSALPKPVVLILDTCEELAKLEPIGQSIPAVEATFEILERLHDWRDVDLRVVFAGRRLLAQGGHKLRDGRWGWRVRPGTTTARTSLLPARKDYLNLHMIRGFTDADVDRYLTVVGLSLDTERRAAILGRSRDTGVAADVDFADDVRPDPAEARYNPFDISLYVDWVQTDSTVTAGVLGSGEKDPYVEMRIIRRVGDLAPIIPGAVLLRRFDEHMLRPMLGDDDEAAARRFRDLAAQEWIDVREGLFQVDANLLERLEDYYEKHDARRIDDARTVLAPALARLARQQLDGDAPFDARTTPLMDAALRLLPRDATADVWDQFERRLTQVRNWSAAQRVCEFLLAQRSAAGHDGSPLRAAVLATLIATRLHTSRDYVPTRDWDEVFRHIEAYPEGPQRACLAARVELGRFNLPLPDLDRLTTAGGGALSWFGAVTDRLDQWQVDQLRGAVCGFLEDATAGGKHVVSDRPLERLAEGVLAPFPPDSPELRMFVQALTGRAADWNESGVGATTAQRWLDWRAPASIRDRSRLIVLRREGGIDQAESRFAALASEIATIDADRLASQLLVLQLERRPVPQQLLDSVDRSALYDPRRVPACDAHREVPPLFQSIGMARIANGDGDGALALAGEVSDRAREHQDTASVDAADLLRLNVRRRFRFPDAMSALDQLLRVQHRNASPFHYRWAPGYASSAVEARSLLDFAAAALSETGSTPGTTPVVRDDGSVDPHVSLDRKEADYLAGRIGDSRRFGESEQVLDPPAFRDVRRGDAALTLRAMALRVDPSSPTIDDRYLLLAGALLEEGELLMLRLPDRALWLLTQAQQMYRNASPVGELIAATCAVIAALKAGDEDRARQMFDTVVGRSYSEIPSSGVALPAWEELSPLTVQEFRSSIWYPWLLRIAAVKARLTEGAAGPLTHQLQPLITRFLGDDGHPDFSLDPYEVVTASPSAADVAASRSLTGTTTSAAAAGSVSSKLPYLRRVEGIALFLAIVGLEIYGLYRFVAWMAAHPQWYPTLIASGLLVGVIGGIPLCLRWFARQFIRDGAVRIEILHRQHGAIFLQQRFRGLSKIAAVLLSMENGGWSVDSPVPDGPPVPLGRVGEHLDWLRQRLRVRPIVPLYVRDFQARHRWEAILDLPLEPQGAPLEERIAYIRAAWRPPYVHSVLLTAAKQAVGIVADPGLAAGFVPSWRNAMVLRPPLAPEDVHAVLHVIGRPRRGRSGPVFLISTGPSDSTHVSARDVQARVTHLLVVQEEPVERLHRLDVDREQTAEARAWAAEAFSAGVNSVILIPAMPSRLAIVVIEALAPTLRPDLTASQSRVRRGEPIFTPWRLAGAVTRARRRVARFTLPKAKDAHTDLRAGLGDAEVVAALNELAIDITLFAGSPYFSRQNP